jgi:hypothetical protein
VRSCLTVGNTISKSYFPQEVTSAAGEKAEIGGGKGWLCSEHSWPSVSKGEHRAVCDGTRLAPSEKQRQLRLKHWSG